MADDEAGGWAERWVVDEAWRRGWQKFRGGARKTGHLPKWLKREVLNISDLGVLNNKDHVAFSIWRYLSLLGLPS